jgi:AbrB family looped-hinge helix DNA binding protein
MITRLSSKGQLIIPKAVRQALGMRTGDRFYLQVIKDKIVLEPDKASPIAILFGKYPQDDFLADLEAEHDQELQGETALRA